MRLAQVFTGLAVGAAAMYFFDPAKGRGRRAHLADAARKQARTKREAIDVMLQDAGNRLRGVKAEISARLDKTEPDDRVVCERVRSEIGRVCSHPSAIEVSMEGDDLCLRGDVLASEVQDVVRAAKSTRGVHAVRNEMEVHQSNDGVPNLQGEGSLATASGRLTPAAGLAAVLTGMGLVLHGMRREDQLGRPIAVAGVLLMNKGFRDTEQRFAPMSDHRSDHNSGSSGDEELESKRQLQAVGSV